ncbi:MAG: tetratricopeptide repeat protein [bacterium]|nr:tetratricopeptide repeat protein [bacterium]
MTRFFLLFILIFSSFVEENYAQQSQASPVETGSKSYYEALLEGKLAFKEGRYDDAIRHLTTVALANRNDIEIWNMLGTIHLKQQNFALAENAFEEAIDIDPGYLPAYQGLAIAQEAMLKSEDALINFQFFIQNFTGTEKDYAVFRTAELLCKFNRYYDAIPLYQNLAKNVDSEFSEEASYYLDNIRNNMAKHQGQKKILGGIPHIVPQQNNCMPSALAAILAYWGEPTSAKELARHLMDTTDGGFLIEMIDFVRNLGFEVSVQQGSFDDIVSWIDKDIPIIVNQVFYNESHIPVVHLRTICGYDRIKNCLYASDIFQIRYDAFMESWHTAENSMLIIVPANKRELLGNDHLFDLEYLARADRYYAQQNYNDAYAIYLEAEIENERNIKARIGQAKSLLKLEKINEAIEELKGIIAVSPSSQEAYFLLGVIYFNNADFETALGYLEKSLSIDQTLFPETHNFLGYIYMEQGNYDAAIEAFKQSITLNPHYMPPQYNLARTYALIGQFERSIEHLAECIENNYISYEKIDNDSLFQPLQNFSSYKKLKEL